MCVCVCVCVCVCQCTNSSIRHAYIHNIYQDDLFYDKSYAIIVQNSLVTNDCLSELEKILALRDPLQTKKEDKVIPEEQTTDDSVQ